MPLRVPGRRAAAAGPAAALRVLRAVWRQRRQLDVEPRVRTCQLCVILAYLADWKVVRWLDLQHAYLRHLRCHARLLGELMLAQSMRCKGCLVCAALTALPRLT